MTDKELTLYQAISDKLGWGDMLASVALPAIERIVNNYIWLVAERHGTTITVDDCWNLVTMESWTPDSIFGLLICDDPLLFDSEDEAQFISLRDEIEWCMRLGFDYIDSIKEWYK